MFRLGYFSFNLSRIYFRTFNVLLWFCQQIIKWGDCSAHIFVYWQTHDEIHYICS